VQINAGLNLAYTTEHFLTFEEAGEDKDGNGSVSDDSVDVPNEYFCGYSPNDICAGKNPQVANVDQVGSFSWFASLILTF
jgi:hypothetical protein